MLRRFLKSFEQGIESSLGKHVHFVDNIDLVASADGSVANRIDDLADVVDPGVAGRVHLDHVDMPAFADRAAGFACIAGSDSRSALPVWTDAVERLGDQP